jgi:hypothetical protein
MKVYKKNSILFIKILTFIFLVIFLFNLDVFRKFYNILNNSYDQRIYKTYGFCSDEAVGFVKYIIKKYNLKIIPKVVKYSGVRNPYWIIFSRKNKLWDDKYIILIGYNNNKIIYLNKIDKDTYSYRANFVDSNKVFDKLSIENIKSDQIININIYNNDKIIYSLNVNLKSSEVEKKKSEISIPKELSDIISSNIYNSPNIIFKLVSKDNIQEDLKITLLLKNLINLNN